MRRVDEDALGPCPPITRAAVDDAMGLAEGMRDLASAHEAHGLAHTAATLMRAADEIECWVLRALRLAHGLDRGGPAARRREGRSTSPGRGGES